MSLTEAQLSILAKYEDPKESSEESDDAGFTEAQQAILNKYEREEM